MGDIVDSGLAAVNWRRPRQSLGAAEVETVIEVIASTLDTSL